MKLSELDFNKKVKITKIKLEKNLKNRLNSLGVTEGVLVKKTHSSILNNAVMIEVLQTRIAIRKEVAGCIYVEEI